MAADFALKVDSSRRQLGEMRVLLRPFPVISSDVAADVAPVCEAVVAIRFRARERTVVASLVFAVTGDAREGTVSIWGSRGWLRVGDMSSGICEYTTYFSVFCESLTLPHTVQR